MIASCDLRSLLNWTEDRATVGTDPSADPEAKTKGGLGGIPTRPLSSFPAFGIGTKAINPRGSGGLVPQPTTSGLLSQPANHHGLRFTLNQNTRGPSLKRSRSGRGSRSLPKSGTPSSTRLGTRTRQKPKLHFRRQLT